MRKETLQNKKTGGYEGNMNAILCSMIRAKSSYGSTKNNDFHPHNKVRNSQGGGREIVLLRDSRREWETMEHQDNHRVFFTSGFFQHEILQTNRGSQNYDYNKDKFFTQDPVGTSSKLGGEQAIVLLDLLWYMTEKKLDAVIIPPRTQAQKSDPTYWSPYSSRYSQLKPKRKELVKVCEDMVEVVCKLKPTSFDDDNRVKWWDEYYHRNLDDIRDTNHEGKNELAKCIQQLYCDTMNKRDDHNQKQTYDKEVMMKVVKSKIRENREWFDLTLNNTHQLIAQGYGFSNGDIHAKALDLLGGGRWRNEYKLITKSAWKRPEPYRLDAMNVVKAELLEWRNKNEN